MEMAAKGGMGIVVDLDHVPQRETGMTPYEIMLSESQERMLLVAAPGKGRRGPGRSSPSGTSTHRSSAEVIEGGRAASPFQGEVVVDIPVDAVVNLCPAYNRPIVAPAPPRRRRTSMSCPEPADLAMSFEKILASPTIANKEWVFGQYDHMVQTNTVFLPGADAAS